jgi:anhydro-N-acetylmuramic acid kinase
MDQNCFVGLMSGTSCDGIDVAIIRPNPEIELLHFATYPIPDELRELILRLAQPGVDEIDAMGGLDRAIGRAFGRATLQAIADAGLERQHIAAIGSHGQTIRHRPKGVDGDMPFTLQIGCAATIAEETGITTIADFRRRDIAAGGEGAPLAPFAHRLLFAQKEAATAVVNIGGIANITLLASDGSVIGFDTGPGNMVMDALMLALSDGRDAYDKNGALAAAGNVCPELLTRLMQHAFLQRRPPKSTGREEFGLDMLEPILSWPDISDADRMATASEFTARSIAESTRFLSETPRRWLICGGGVENAQLMQRLAELLAPAMVGNTAASGIAPEAVEAVCFALLGRQTLMGEENTIAAVTGATHAVCGGQITPGANWQALLQAIPAWTR